MFVRFKTRKKDGKEQLAVCWTLLLAIDTWRGVACSWS